MYTTTPSCILEKSELAINHAGVVEVLWNLPNPSCAIMQDGAIPKKPKQQQGGSLDMNLEWAIPEKN